MNTADQKTTAKVNKVNPKHGFPFPIYLTCKVTGRVTKLTNLEYVKRKIEKLTAANQTWEDWVNNYTFKDKNVTTVQPEVKAEEINTPEIQEETKVTEKEVKPKSKKAKAKKAKAKKAKKKLIKADAETQAAANSDIAELEAAA